ncbi:hypothetical protein ACFLTU_10760 [Bacteroidota bacterium]
MKTRENFLRKKLRFFAKRIPILVALLVISMGISFSQGIVTVTSDTDDGAGSFRAAIAAAVDGDTILFSSGIDTILVGLPLELGATTLVIGSMDSAWLRLTAVC